jgi:hypothetical protein
VLLEQTRRRDHQKTPARFVTFDIPVHIFLSANVLEPWYLVSLIHYLSLAGEKSTHQHRIARIVIPCAKTLSVKLHAKRYFCRGSSAVCFKRDSLHKYVHRLPSKFSHIPLRIFSQTINVLLYFSSQYRDILKFGSRSVVKVFESYICDVYSEDGRRIRLL